MVLLTIQLFFSLTGLVPSYDQFCCKPGEDAILSCCLCPATSAAGMNILWFKGTECIYIYKSGKVRERNDYKGRLRLCLEELISGKITLRLTHMTEQDSGNYMCKVIYGREHTYMKFGLRVNFSPYSKSPPFWQQTLFLYQLLYYVIMTVSIINLLYYYSHISPMTPLLLH